MIPKIVILSGAFSLMAAQELGLVTHSEFSYINTKGNTDTTSLAFEGMIDKKWDEHDLRLHLDAYRSTDKGKTSKNKWSSELNYDYSLSTVSSLNYLIGYKEDRFSGFDYQFYTGPGLGTKLMDTPEHKLTTQVNILYGKDKPDNLPSDSYFSGKMGAIYRWQVLENLKFIQEATYRINLEATKYNFFYSKTAVENKINSTLSMGVSYKIDYVNTPPPPSVRTDRTFLVSLIIDY